MSRVNSAVLDPSEWFRQTNRFPIAKSYLMSVPRTHEITANICERRRAWYKVHDRLLDHVTLPRLIKVLHSIISDTSQLM